MVEKIANISSTFSEVIGNIPYNSLEREDDRNFSYSKYLHYIGIITGLPLLLTLLPGELKRYSDHTRRQMAQQIHRAVGTYLFVIKKTEGAQAGSVPSTLRGMADAAARVINPLGSSVHEIFNRISDDAVAKKALDAANTIRRVNKALNGDEYELSILLGRIKKAKAVVEKVVAPRESEDAVETKAVQKKLPRGWLPLDQIPEGTRELVRIAREQIEQVFDGSFPHKGFKTADGWFSGYLKDSPIRKFIMTGRLVYTDTNPPKKFWMDLKMAFLYVRKVDPGEYEHIEPTEEIEKLIFEYIQGERDDWVPLKEIPEGRRKIVEMARKKAITLFGGVLPALGFTTKDGWSSPNLYRGPLLDLIVRGKIIQSTTYYPIKYWEFIRKALLDVAVNLDGEYYHLKENANFDEAIHKAIADHEGWLPLSEIPEAWRPFMKALRKKVIEVSGGRFPYLGIETIDGWKSGSLHRLPLRNFLKDAKLEYTSGNTGISFWRDVSLLVFNLELMPDGKYRHVFDAKDNDDLEDYLDDVDKLIYERISEMEGWKPLHHIKDREYRLLVQLARKKAAQLFGGRFPSKGFYTEDGWFSGNLEKTSLKRFLIGGYIHYSHNKQPQEFWSDLRLMLFGTSVDKKGIYRHVKIDSETELLIRKYEDQGVALWDGRGTGYGAVIEHSVPGLFVEGKSKKERALLLANKAVNGSMQDFERLIKHLRDFNPSLEGLTLERLEGALTGFDDQYVSKLAEILGREFLGDSAASLAERIRILRRSTNGAKVEVAGRKDGEKSGRAKVEVAGVAGRGPARNNNGSPGQNLSSSLIERAINGDRMALDDLMRFVRKSDQIFRSLTVEGLRNILQYENPGLYERLDKIFGVDFLRAHRESLISRLSRGKEPKKTTERNEVRRRRKP
ncbi:hypothetical protein KKA47_07075 [bacterium]|nr:hypothetical protein [bacterium]